MGYTMTVTYGRRALLALLLAIASAGSSLALAETQPAAEPDTTPPETTITSGPTSLTDDSTPTFSFDGSDDISTTTNLLYSYRVDDGEWSGYSSETGATLASLSDGAHTFYAKSKDEAGNEDQTPAQQSFAVDTAPSRATFVPEADARVDEEVPDTNHATGTLWTRGSPLGVRKDSYLRFQVTGLTGAVESAKIWVKSFDGTPNGPTVNQTSSDWQENEITWNNKPAAEGSQIADVGAVATDSWVEYDVSDLVDSDGTYSVVLSQTSSDRAKFYSRENFAIGPQLVVTMAETTPPETTITSGPDGSTNDDTPTFSFGGSDNETASANLLYSYKVDDGEWSEYAADTSATLGGSSGLSDGAHTFYAKAKDEAGNEDESPAQRNFTVESRSPRVETADPTGTGASRIGNITATFSEPMKPSTLVTTPTDPANPNVGTSKTIKMKLGTKTIPATVNLSPDGKTVTLDPYPTDTSKLLAANRKYKVTIATIAEDLDSNKLDQDPAQTGDQPKVWNFTTGAR